MYSAVKVVTLCSFPSPSHLDVSTTRDLDPISTVSNHIILHNLPVTPETDAMSTVFINAVTTKLHSAVFLHRYTTSAIVHNAVCNQPGKLTALQHSNAGATVTVHKVRENIQGLTALHVQTNCCRKGRGKDGEDVRRMKWVT